MSTATSLMTAEQLWRMPKEEGRCELVRGELNMMAPAGGEHGSIIGKLTFLLGKFVYAKKLGIVVGAETGFVLTRDPDTVRGIDIGFISAARIPDSGPPKKFWVGAPDLVVEVLSPSDRPKAVAKKVEDYLTAGASIVWVVVPKNQTVIVHRAMMEPKVLESSKVLSGGRIIPGFKCKVEEIFT
jgi:Uma2 family endonuclease